MIEVNNLEKIAIYSMDICPTSQFICSLKYPETRLRTLHNLICDPETFLCDKHIAIMTGDIDSLDYLFYAPVTYRGATMLREAVACAEDRDFCDISILDDEIIFSGLSTGSCCLAMESMPDGVKLSEAIYTYSHSRLIKGFKRFKSRLKQADISHNNLSLNNIFIDIDDDWYTICNYSITKLSTAHVMKYQTFFSCINYSSVIKFSKLFCKLCFFC